MAAAVVVPLPSLLEGGGGKGGGREGRWGLGEG